MLSCSRVSLLLSQYWRQTGHICCIHIAGNHISLYSPKLLMQIDETLSCWYDICLFQQAIFLDEVKLISFWSLSKTFEIFKAFRGNFSTELNSNLTRLSSEIESFYIKENLNILTLKQISFNSYQVWFHSIQNKLILLLPKY